MLISIENHITCDFPVGVRTPYPPLDPHMLNYLDLISCCHVNGLSEIKLI